MYEICILHYETEIVVFLVKTLFILFMVLAIVYIQPFVHTIKLQVIHKHTGAAIVYFNVVRVLMSTGGRQIITEICRKGFCLWITCNFIICICWCIYRGADKSLAQPGKNDGKTTMIKLGHPGFDGGIRWVHVPQMFLSEWREFPTTPSIPSYNIGKLVGLRTYQHPCK
jgi:hypothetical protein